MFASAQNRLDGTVYGDLLIVAGNLTALGTIRSEERIRGAGSVDGPE